MVYEKEQPERAVRPRLGPSSQRQADARKQLDDGAGSPQSIAVLQRLTQPGGSVLAAVTGAGVERSVWCGDVRGMAGQPRLVNIVSSAQSEEDAAQEKPPPGTDSFPAGKLVWLRPPPVSPDAVVVDDLSRFLADPRQSGGSAISLTRDQVDELLTVGRTETVVAGRAVPIVVDEAHESRNENLPLLVPAALAVASGVTTTGGFPGSPPSVEIPLALQWNQLWEFQGYSRGALPSTFFLAPQEQTTIELFSWDRRRNESEITSSVETHNNLDTAGTTRDTAMLRLTA